MRLPPAFAKLSRLVFEKAHTGVALTGLIVAMSGPALRVAASSLSNENLISPLPSGFKVGAQSNNGTLSAFEFVPNGETVNSWSQMVTVQIFHNLRDQNADGLPESMKPKWLAACPGSKVGKIKDGTENGYPFSLWLFTCPSNPSTGRPENMFQKIISGSDSLYSVQYAYRREMNKDIIPPTMQYMQKVIACDTRLPEKPCPAGM